MEFKSSVINVSKNSTFEINVQEFTEEEFSKSFIPSFYLTVYKYQGGEINADYNIYDVNQMDKKLVLHSIE